METTFDQYVAALKARIENDPEMLRAEEVARSIIAALDTYMTEVRRRVLRKHTDSPGYPVTDDATFTLAKKIVLHSLEVPEIAAFLDQPISKVEEVESEPATPPRVVMPAPVDVESGAQVTRTEHGMRFSFEEVNAPEAPKQAVDTPPRVRQAAPEPIKQDRETENPAEVGTRSPSDPFQRLRARRLHVEILGGEVDTRKLERMREMSGLGKYLVWYNATVSNADLIAKHVKSGTCLGVVVLETLMSHRDFYPVVDATRKYHVPLTYAGRVNIDRILGCVMLIENGKSSSMGSIIVPFNPANAFYMPDESPQEIVSAEVVSEEAEVPQEVVSAEVDVPQEVEETSVEETPEVEAPHVEDTVDVPVLWAKSMKEAYVAWYREIRDTVIPLMEIEGVSKYPNGYDLDSIMSLVASGGSTTTHRRMVGAIMSALGFENVRFDKRSHYVRKGTK